MTRLTTEALDALLAEHRPVPNDRVTDAYPADFYCCSEDHRDFVEHPCSIYLLASEVRDARPVTNLPIRLGVRASDSNFIELRDTSTGEILWFDTRDAEDDELEESFYGDLMARLVRLQRRAGFEADSALAHYEEGAK